MNAFHVSSTSLSFFRRGRPHTLSKQVLKSCASCAVYAGVFLSVLMTLEMLHHDAFPSDSDSQPSQTMREKPFSNRLRANDSVYRPTALPTSPSLLVQLITDTAAEKNFNPPHTKNDAQLPAQRCNERQTISRTVSLALIRGTMQNYSPVGALRFMGYDVMFTVDKSVIDEDPEMKNIWYLFSATTDRATLNLTNWSVVSNPKAFKVNHYPDGLRAISHKRTLVSTLRTTFIPDAFFLPQDMTSLRQYLKNYPEKLLTLKEGIHRGVSVITTQETQGILANYTKYSQDHDMEDWFLQEYISDPLLIDNRKFDLQVFVVVTSINPVRIYVDDQWAIRLCSKEYNPQSSTEDGANFVCNRQYEIEGKEFTNPDGIRDQTMSTFDPRSVFFYMVEKQGINDKDLIERVSEAARRSALHAGPVEQKYLEDRKIDPRGFYESLRMDISVDSRGYMHLIEFNAFIRENVVDRAYKTLRLLGAGALFDASGEILREECGPELDFNVVPERELQVYADLCQDPSCLQDCKVLVCQLCSQCMTAELRNAVRDSYQEHTMKIDHSRAFPVTWTSQLEAASWNLVDQSELNRSSPLTVLVALWFRGKCLQDYTWCS